ncbi:hypothetical protein BRCH_01709 [Candidatus Burkholderia brachyanthoides]|nr:hypothetical protein BRCH_01709 [Candidatus Burkholderia brachyanthoides]
MWTSRHDRVIKFLSEVIDAELTAAWKSMECGPTINDIHDLSKVLALKIVESDDVASALSATSDSKLKWISTEEAAKKSGFSRPFIAAAIDSGVYSGRVNKTPKGHRRVLSGEFDDWIKLAREGNVSMSLEDARSGLDIGPSSEQRTEDAENSRKKRARRLVIG